MIEIRTVPAQEVYEIRYRILRPNAESMDAVHFNGDFDQETKHFVAVMQDDIASAVSVMKASNDLFILPNQYQMRGLATYLDYRNKGLAKALVKNVEFYTFQLKKADILWLNARVDVVDFYLKMGYKAIGQPFMIENVCEHIVMYKDLGTYLVNNKCSHDCSSCKGC